MGQIEKRFTARRGISATVWRNEDGGRSVSLSRSYKDEKGETKYSNSYYEDDLAHLQEVCRRASDFMANSRDAEKQTSREVVEELKI